MPTRSRIWIPLATAAIALASLGARAEELKFVASLNGAAQLPEPTGSKATGECTLVVHDGDKKISYTLSVTNLENPSGADIHLGSTSMNGPSVVKLFPVHGAAAKKGPYTGVLAEGTITASDLAGPMQGSPLADLVDELKGGNAYVNVHTNDGVDPPNSGPGDFRLGEIRGQFAAK
ncbi:MAG: CHRD domain-containing protein [Steroidobacteraceae bacterium]